MIKKATYPLTAVQDARLGKFQVRATGEGLVNLNDVYKAAYPAKLPQHISRDLGTALLDVESASKIASGGVFGIMSKLMHPVSKLMHPTIATAMTCIPRALCRTTRDASSDAWALH